MGNSINKKQKRTKHVGGYSQVEALKYRRSEYIRQQGDEFLTVKVDISPPEQYRVHRGAMTTRDHIRSISTQIEREETLKLSKKFRHKSTPNIRVENNFKT
ncbi:hypothetical protein AKO1_001706 [Acrasis kona]|uniref:Uncharacterized protein n=1 Tax=Acrasis kona TaxID=1008807 RepID=A0AAW2Z809_9EUKA